ncbi:hypothetical protein [Endozoicomonas sp. SCSIO W0465]|uniref:hypothetical protein n=1 Tax=Endozoicomonas sp. SCSIO W0465 TaxID=2918516 RepID=UPI00207555C2|nr:hypothetical protein [Endozoicomonas sp. SCSIO W0465]USE39037.1 hypothetical protein MJO57_13295 [Endozoicomonas sp. SCSIO W0465]
MTGAVNFSSLPVAVDQGKYTREYLDDVESKALKLAELREDREKRPGWNTLKTVAINSLVAVAQTGQLIGSIFGHVVFALPSALLGGVFGFCIYAPFMKAVDCLSGGENTKSFFEYTITPANKLSNLIYNRVTDLVCRYVVGCGVMVAVVEPFHVILGGLAVGTLLSPFIYNDFKCNSSRNVEFFIDGPANFSVKLSAQHYFWQTFDDWAEGIKRPPVTLYDRIAAQVHGSNISVKDSSG